MSGNSMARTRIDVPVLKLDMLNADGRHSFLGIDPGMDGGLALYNPVLSTLTAIRMPTYTVTTDRKFVSRRREIDVYALGAWFELYASTILHVFIEHVHARPGQGVTSMFSFGTTVGVCYAMCGVHGLPFTEVSPGVWKQAMGCTSHKGDSLERASLLFPRFKHFWSTKGDDGVAEAALIAAYGSSFAFARSKTDGG
jgi:crossover junction endodeoxyribonuclease RuvC